MSEDKVNLPEIFDEEATSIIAADTKPLNQEAQDLINQLVAEHDIEKAKDLTYLFNVNQNKKTMVRVNKFSDLLDVMTDQVLKRVSARPDEISTKELLDGIKTIQDMIERGTKMASGVPEAPTPLIQINQQINETNVDTSLSRDSRERVKNAVSAVLNSLGVVPTTGTPDVVIEPSTEEDTKND